jgi:hypothetical protein
MRSESSDLSSFEPSRCARADYRTLATPLAFSLVSVSSDVPRSRVLDMWGSQLHITMAYGIRRLEVPLCFVPDW